MKEEIAHILADLITTVERGGRPVIFLIEYDRPVGRIVSYKIFEDSQRSPPRTLDSRSS